jgi:hypothetical protein
LQAAAQQQRAEHGGAARLRTSGICTIAQPVWPGSFQAASAAARSFLVLSWWEASVMLTTCGASHLAWLDGWAQ